ncbi:Asp-tRNA(Asn)/Glu-tRNA(Gln) amidotransferase subunit GatC [Hydrogenovibrio marinus]|uniref:Aspartyl/glutamyl-tRNA(Asn/Gln) amidotransferase subunit C n=1 Tax=Hydrogenovibrio marinus TaxID=28885 RepID=A0A066ZSS5_HYDMR|nr:Asp-tRNA(Asn)/Glu-tRNA(Gln) amidotransferase subunit GatC [Hydrogenovibrio marinus]KDN96542.1 glutamyl-tRNA amidotransferase [Hydrogenovibrio marinus]BBN60252.1 aspartyl/glutamyl-tRNA(Asn/Gln) amidotransferase subunit C [Hydrogenovibrio marinus]
MSIGKDDVNKISRLAAISVSEQEVDQVADKLSNILDLFAQMQAVNTDGVEPMSHPLDQVQRLREDVVTESNNRDKYQKIAPSAEGGMYLVPQVIE